jgi:ABC-type transport system involved in multi-copper enzyme maturation permease subunit
MTLITVELAKLSGTPAKISTLAAPVMGAALALPLVLRYEGAIWFDYIAATLSVSNALLIPCLIGLLAAFVFGREAVDGTQGGLRHSPFSAWKVVAAKCLAVILLGSAMTAISAASSLAFGLGAGLKGFYWPLVYRYFTVCAIVCTVAGCTVPIVGVVALLTRGYFVASVVTTVGTLLGSFLLGTGWLALNPWSLPAYYVSGFLRLLSRDPIRLVPEVLPAATVFAAVGFAFAVFVHSNSDLTLER